MVAADEPAAAAWGGLAIELAERLGGTEVLVHSLNNVGAVATIRDWHADAVKLQRSLELARGDPDPWEPLDEALALARRHGEAAATAARLGIVET